MKRSSGICEAETIVCQPPLAKLCSNGSISSGLVTMANTSLRISPRVHLWLLCGTVLSALFGFVYARLVCQYICALPTDRLARNIAIVSLAQFALRHHLLTRPIPWQSARTTARTLFLRSVLSWFVAGALAIGLHFALYPDFPVGSHFKFALAYWALGGGLCNSTGIPAV